MRTFVMYQATPLRLKMIIQFDFEAFEAHTVQFMQWFQSFKAGVK